MTRFIIFPERNPHASKRADEITQARLQEVWGDDYDGQTVWPDGITVSACSIAEHKDGRAALGFDERHEPHLTGDERRNGKTYQQIREDGWFEE